jgi:hypothetical protein
VVNALVVSFLEHLNLEDGKTQRSWAVKLMPTDLAKEYAAARNYHSKSASKQPNKSCMDSSGK